jgi:hypothetical protein
MWTDHAHHNRTRQGTRQAVVDIMVRCYVFLLISSLLSPPLSALLGLIGGLRDMDSVHISSDDHVKTDGQNRIRPWSRPFLPIEPIFTLDEIRNSVFLPRSERNQMKAFTISFMIISQAHRIIKTEVPRINEREKVQWHHVLVEAFPSSRLSGCIIAHSLQKLSFVESPMSGENG